MICPNIDSWVAPLLTFLHSENLFLPSVHVLQLVTKQLKRAVLLFHTSMFPQEYLAGGLVKCF